MAEPIDLYTVFFRRSKSERRGEDERPRVTVGRGTTRMNHALETGLHRPPRGHLRFVIYFHHGLVVSQRRECAGEQRVYVALRAADVVTQLQVGTGEANRIPIARRNESFVNQPAIDPERRQISIFWRSAQTEKADQPLLRGMSLPFSM